ncbi:hypothetical protein OOK36_35620 [Streptomyces sp. NBC_00365]|uniref:hypothetical protein n=1 Tax=Streptomyces sp. NBC_00365 TaxID=2975726 RepID=UPI002251BEFE|nr:hypothetical protein [Streptomyces sp. NBC_00365]MCX5094102.1 hypothetical protein [Streptomyces sp. NBC_00365]
MVSTDGEMNPPRSGVLGWIRSFPERLRTAKQQLRSLPQAEQGRVERYALERLEKLRALSSLDEETRDRIEPAISRAAREAHIREGRITALREFRAEHRWIRWVSNLAITFILWWALLVWALALPLKSLPPADQSDTLVYAMFALILVFILFGKLLGRRNGRYGGIMAAVIVFCITTFVAVIRDWWITEILKLTANPAIQAWHPTKERPVADMAGGAILAAVSIITARVAVLILLLEAGRAAYLAAGTAEPNASASAMFVDSVLEIAWGLEVMVRDLGREDSANQVPSQEDSPVGSYEYLSSPDRKQLLERLENTAQFIEGHWHRTARLKDHAANVEVRRVADGIASSVRRWKPVAAIGGQDGMQEMRDAFAIALVNSAEGEWGLLAGDVSARELFSRRLIKLLRRILALLVIAATILATFVRPFDWMSGLGNAAVAAPLMVAAVFFAGFIDPTIYDRMAPAAKLGAELLPKR